VKGCRSVFVCTEAITQKKKKKSNNAQQLNSACFQEGAKKPEFLTISSSVVSQPMTTSD
jgi:hypothetical protein